MTPWTRLNIVAHDRFQEIIDEANRADSQIRLTRVFLDPATDLQKMRTVVSQSKLGEQLSGQIAIGDPAFGFSSTLNLFGRG